MCGIIISKDGKKINSINHRGIQFTSYDNFPGWIFGHHRLPIQTLEGDEWTQPIILSRATGDFFLFNGEIFNYPREYNSDSEYLKSFFTSSPLIDDIIEEANRWDGFWSIVYKKGNKLIVFTDPLGKKQLYYDERTKEFSSEVKSFLPPNPTLDDLDSIFLSSINKWGYNTDNRTILKSIKRIMPNTIYVFSISQFHNYKPIEIYSEYFKWNKNIPYDKSIYQLLDTSVQSRLISKKYKVSALFSGGLDSTIILYFLRKYGADVDVYSIANAEDEEYIRFMEKEWNLDLKFLSVNPDNVSDEERMRIYKINDSPIDLGSVIPQYYLFSEIPNKIVLTGDGADELFGGYRRINTYDSQKSDVFQELPFYHLPRIDRMSMNFTIEARNPFLSHDIVKRALALPFEDRKNKAILKREFRGLIPDEIIGRKKNPLKIQRIRDNEFEYRNEIIGKYINYLIK